MRYINVDAFINDKLSKICSKCDRRKSNDGKRFIYAVGQAPCRACELGDMMDEIDDFPTADVVEVVRCKDCKYARNVRNRNQEDCDYICCCFRDNPDKMDVVDYYRFMVRPDGYCYRGAKMDGRKE